MNKLAIRLLTLAMLSLTLAAAPVVSVVYAAPDNDPPPPDKKKKKKRLKKCSLKFSNLSFNDIATTGNFGGKGESVFTRQPNSKFCFRSASSSLQRARW